MRKYLTLFVSMAMISGASFAQTIQQKIDEQAKDKKRAENAAKADVYITNKKNIVDSSSKANKVTTTTKHVKKHSKKKVYKKS